MVRASQESTLSLFLKHFQKRSTTSLILVVQMVLKLNYITLIFHDKMVTCVRDPWPHFHWGEV